MPPGGLHIRWPDAPLEQEARLMDYKWYAALAYVRANRLNHNVIEGPHDRFGIIASGKAYNDTRQALLDLGLDDDDLPPHRHPRCTRSTWSGRWRRRSRATSRTACRRSWWSRRSARSSSTSSRRSSTTGAPTCGRNVLGKFDEAEGDAAGGEWCAQPERALAAARQRRPDAGDHRQGHRPAAEEARRRRRHRARAWTRGWRSSRPRERALARRWTRRDRRARALVLLRLPAQHLHRVPEGSRAMAGIGCHYMAVWMDRSTIDLQPDGRRRRALGRPGAVHDRPAHVRQPRRRHLLPLAACWRPPVHRRRRQHHLQDPLQRRGRDDRRPAGRRAARGHRCRRYARARCRGRAKHRRRHRRAGEVPTARRARAGRRRCTTATSSTRVQRELREINGRHGHHLRPDLRDRRSAGAASAARWSTRPSAWSSTSWCAKAAATAGAEQLPVGRAARDRVRPQAPHQPEHLQQGLLVPQGLLPELRHGRRRPAEEAEEGAPRATVLAACRRCPSRRCRWPSGAWGIVVAGVGGTGVITIGQLLGMAAHLEGKGIVTQDAAGLAQKGGATWSHVQIANRPEAIHTTKVGTAEADLVIGCDPIVAASKDDAGGDARGPHLRRAQHPRARRPRPSSSNPDWQFPAALRGRRSREPSAPTASAPSTPSTWRVQLLGDSIYTNPLMLGLRLAAGPGAAGACGADARDRAQRRAGREQQGGVRMGPPRARTTRRRCRRWSSAGAGDRVREEAGRSTSWSPSASSSSPATRTRPTPAQYKAFVDKVRAAEVARLGSGTRSLTEAVARYLFKLMAYKDEYEVARLHTDPAFPAKIAAHVRRRLQDQLHHLAPPLIAKRNAKGELQKQPFGPWMLHGVPRAGEAQGPARHRVRHLRPHRGAQHRARADRRVPRAASRKCCARSAPATWRWRSRSRASRRDPRLRPRQGAPPGGGAAKWDALMAAGARVAQASNAPRSGRASEGVHPARR